MSTLVFLDTGPLGMVTNPRATEQTERCSRWLEGLLAHGVRVLVPEIADPDDKALNQPTRDSYTHAASLACAPRAMCSIAAVTSGS